MVPPVVIEFSLQDLRPVLTAMVEMADAGRGWINLQPAVDPDDLTQTSSGMFRMFSAVGSEVPLCTWTPTKGGRRSPPAVSLGVQHGVGTKLVPRLTEIGIEVPAGWRVVQDQSRRGLVVSVPADERHDVVLVWLLEVGEAVCRPDHDGWVAALHRPTGRG